MSDPIERAAIALILNGSGCATGVNRAAFRHDEILSACEYKECRCLRAVRAVIAELREPTEAMCDAGNTYCTPPDEVWRAMIDALLA